MELHSQAAPMAAVLQTPAMDGNLVKVRLPTFHPAQSRAYKLVAKTRRIALRCGRRWGKNVFGETIAASDAIKGRPVGWFAPEHKRLAESFNAISDLLDEVKRQPGGSNKTDRVIRTITGGRVEFWSLEDPNAGRSRRYYRVFGDEVAFTKPNMIDIWQRAIEPTLVDYDGSAVMMSNTKGIASDNFMWQICNDPKLGFTDLHAPTRSNILLPLIKPGEAHDVWLDRRRAFFEELKAKTPPLVYQQEYMAQFVDWSGDAFFSIDSFLVNGQPIEYPARCEAVYAVIDTATKTGKEHDGTGVVYYALVRQHIRPVAPDGTIGPEYNVVILDWDLKQIEGALLDTWLRTVFENLEHLSRLCCAQRGSIGAMIEDKSSGMVLLQQAANRGWPAHPIESKLTAMGKDERAISVGSYVYRGLCKMTRTAFEKTVVFKEVSRNHLRGQITGYRVGDKDAAKRADDILDCVCYGLAIALGNSEGF